MSATPEREQADLGARLRAAQLQERLGFSISAATSNDWQGAYCIVDFDALEQVAAAVERERELTRALGVIAAFIESRHKEGDTDYQAAIVAREALAGGVSAAGRPYGTLGQDTRSWIERQGGFTTGHGGTSDQRTFSSDPYPAAPEVSPRKPAHPPKDASNHTGRAAPEVLPEETR